MKTHKRTHSDPTTGILQHHFNRKPSRNKGVSNHGRSEDQIEQLTKSLPRYVEKYGEGHPKVSHLRNAIGNAFFNRGDFQMAEIEYVKALDAVRKQNDDCAHLATTLGNLGTVYWNMGNFDSSISCLEESLSLHRQISGGSESNVRVANALHNLGMARFFNKDFNEAQKVLEKALRLRKDILGIYHIDVARTLDVLGKVYITKQIHTLAMSSHMEALSIKIRVLGKRNPSSVISLMNVANVYRCKDEFDDAINLYKDALIIQQEISAFDESLEVDVGTTLHTIGDIQVQKSSFFGALSTYREASYIYENAGLDQSDRRVMALNKSVEKAQRLLETSDLFLIREQSSNVIDER